MRMKELPTYLIELAKKYNVKLIRYDACAKNAGASSGDCIWLGDYDNPDNELITFFHELVHCKFYEDICSFLNIDKLPDSLSFLSNEGTCWEYGLALAKANGYEWDFESEPYKYAFEQYITYIGDDRDIFCYKPEYTNKLDYIKSNLKELESNSKKPNKDIKKDTEKVSKKKT
jgi:hypothetical protein